MTGLDLEYNPVVSTVLARVEPISYSDLLNQLLSFEQCLDLLQGGAQSYVNFASRGRGGNNNNGNRGCGGPPNRGSGRGNGGRGRGTPNSGGGNYGQKRPKCQVCLKGTPPISTGIAVMRIMFLRRRQQVLPPTYMELTRIGTPILVLLITSQVN